LEPQLLAVIVIGILAATILGYFLGKH